MNVAENVTYWSAFLGGLLSFLSPCIIPVLPMYVSVLSGDMEGNNKKKLYINSIGFLLGLTTVNIILGASASALGQLFIEYKLVLAKGAGIIIILLGLFQMGIINPNFLLKERKLKLKIKGGSFVPSYLLGIGFSFGWTPCISAILAPILTMVAGHGNVFVGIIALSLYSLGFMLPFLISTFFMSKLMDWVNRSDRTLDIIKKFSGALMVIVGFLIYQNWLYKLMMF